MRKIVHGSSVLFYIKYYVRDNETISTFALDLVLWFSVLFNSRVGIHVCIYCLFYFMSVEIRENTGLLLDYTGLKFGHW